jgi:hypothetical protein
MIIHSPILRYAEKGLVRVFAGFHKGKLEIDDDMMPPSTIAEGKEAAHMLMRLYDKQPKDTQNAIILILAAWRKSTRTAPPTT